MTVAPHVEGPFFHGTKSQLGVGAEPVPGYGSNFQQRRVSANNYFIALVETAAWGAELATALAGGGVQGMLDDLAQLRERGIDVIEDSFHDARPIRVNPLQSSGARWSRC